MVRESRDGPPLAETLFCLLILGLVGAVAIPPMVYSRDDRASACRANVELLNCKIAQWAADHNGWAPADQATFQRLVAGDPDLRGHLPACPYGETYVYDPAAGHIVPHGH